MFWSAVRGEGNGDCIAVWESQRREIARKGEKYSFDGRHARGVAADVSGEIPGHEWSSEQGWGCAREISQASAVATIHHHRRRTEILIPHENQDTLRIAVCRDRDGSPRDDVEPRSRAAPRQRFVFIAERRRSRVEPTAEIYDAGEFTASGSRHVKRARERSQWRFHWVARRY